MTTSSAGALSPAVIERAMKEFELRLSEQQVQQIQQYTSILLDWNEKLNLTAIRDPLEILYRHFCESMYGATLLPVENCRLADVGSGGGFPGLPLKILRPAWEVFLIESNVKKATFLAEVVRELGLSNAKVLVSRFEELGEEVAARRGLLPCSGRLSTLPGLGGFSPGGGPTGTPMDRRPGP